MRWKVSLLAGALAGCCAMGHAQMDMSGGTAGSAGAAVSPAQAEDKLLSLFEHELMGVVEAMPADKFNFSPANLTAGQQGMMKYNGVRTFAQEATHIAGGNYYFFSGFGVPKPAVDVKAISSMTNKDQIVAALKQSFAYAHQAIATMTPANAFTTIPEVDGMNTRATVASFAVAHGYDHYGQMVEYLRMNGVVPPGSK